MSRQRIESCTRRWVLWLEPQRARLLTQAHWPAADAGAWALHRDVALPTAHEPGWAAAVEGLLGEGPAASWRRFEVVLAGSLVALLPLSLGAQRLPRRVRQAFAEARVHAWFHESAGTWQVRLPSTAMRGDTVASAVRQPVLQAVVSATRTLRRAAAVLPAAWWAAQQLQASSAAPAQSGLRWTMLAEADRCSGVLWQGARPVHCVLLQAVGESKQPDAAWWQALEAWEARVGTAQNVKPAVVLARLDDSRCLPLQAAGRQAHAVGLLAPPGGVVAAGVSIAGQPASAS